MSEKGNNSVRDLLAGTNRLTAIDSETWNALRKAYAETEFVQWTDQLAALLADKTGYSGVLDFARATLDLARRFGPSTSLCLEPSVYVVRHAAGEKAALAFLASMSEACSHIADAQGFRSFLMTMEDMARLAPESFVLLCRRLGVVLPKLDARGFHAWAHAGVRNAGDNPETRRSYFALKDQSAMRAFEQASSDVLFVDIEPRAVGLVQALWSFRPVVRTVAIRPGQPAPRRVAFDGPIVWMPEAFSGRQGEDAVLHYKAALAHVGAHAAYSGGRFPRGNLKQIQLSLVSLIEDVRVENLAMQDFPGLRRLWARYHVAQPGTALTAELLMPRLARALIDPGYHDDDPWVNRGRMMFFRERDNWHDPQISRTIGGLLGNDLGQMRIQFNAKTYVVEPSYREDHAGLWEADEQPPEESQAAEVILNAARIEQKDTDTPQKKHEKGDDQQHANMAAEMVPAHDQDGLPIARLAEWDYVDGVMRREWVTVKEYIPDPAPIVAARDLLEGQAAVSNRIKRLVKSAKISRPEWQGRQMQGERLDLEACINSTIDMRCGLAPDPRLYQVHVLKKRDLSVSVLLDISESTRDRVRDTTRTIISVARSATALLAEAMDGMGDPFAVSGFCSDGREDVRLYRVKTFSQPFDAMARRRLAGLRGRLSTRLGAALRQAGAELSDQRTHRRLVLIITDGEPSDIDVSDGKYLVEDARRAVHDLSNKGIDVLCIGVQRQGQDALQRIFGRRGFAMIDRAEALAEKLPMIYMRLTT